MKRKTKKQIETGYGLGWILHQLIESVKVYAKRCEDPEIHSPLQREGRLEKLNKLLEDYDKAYQDVKEFDIDKSDGIKYFINLSTTRKDLLIFIVKNYDAFWD